MKRQNIIYELVLTERHHCQVLVLLQQLYYEGLAHNRILTPKQLQLVILKENFLNNLQMFGDEIFGTFFFDTVRPSGSYKETIALGCSGFLKNFFRNL